MNAPIHPSSARSAIPPRAWAVYVAMCLIFGTTFLAIKVGANEGLPPFLAAGARFTVAGVLLIAGRSAFRRPRRADTVQLPLRQYLPRAVLLGVLLVGLTFAGTYSAADRIGSGHIAQIQALAPVIVAVLSVAVLRTRFTGRHAVGLAGGLLGALLLVGAAGEVGAGALAGAMLALTAELSYGLGSIWFRIGFPHGTDTIRTNGLSMLFGGLLLLAFALVAGQQWGAPSPRAYLSIGYLIVFGSIAGHSMYLWLLSTVSPMFASTWLFVSPVIATALGALILGEAITWWNGLGALAVLSGVYFVQSGERREE